MSNANNNNSNRIMETSMNSSLGPRKIHPRRKPAESEKNYKCSCGKSYLSNESLYTHRKTKHPDEIVRQFQVPDKGDINITNLEKDDTVKKVLVNNDTFNMLTKSAFLNFFRMMKLLADDQKEVLKLFHSEKKGYTQLNMDFFAQGAQSRLVYFVKAYRLHENIQDPQAVRLMNSSVNSQWQNINLLNSSKQALHQIPGLAKQESFDLGVGVQPMNESYNIDFNIENNKIAESVKQFGGQNDWEITVPNLKNEQDKWEDIPEYYRDFFTIAKEMVKPMTEKFAMEMCYLFDRLIELSSVQHNQKIQEYKDNNQKELLKLIGSFPDIFPKFSGLSNLNRETLIDYFLFNLAHLFQSGERVPDN